ncbi:MAG: hypothetical protein Q9219_003242 [cf. Caloplaca sp. 3 TL-2023]
MADKIVSMYDDAIDVTPRGCQCVACKIQTNPSLDGFESAKHGAAGLDYADRLEAVRLTQSITVDLEDPGDLIDRIIYQPAENALIRVAVDIGLFEVLNKSQLPLNAQRLAEKTNTELLLLERILRGLVALHAIEEVNAEDYGPTKISEAFATPKGVSGIRLL